MDADHTAALVADARQPLLGRHALITGGASGLGLGCARRFARLGARITVADINARAAVDVLAQLQRAGGAGHRFETLDLSAPANVADFARRLRDRGEPLHLLINNAGIYPPSRRSLSAQGNELTFEIAVLGHFALTQLLWPLLDASPGARVITISSLVQKTARMDLDDLSLAHGYQPIRAYQQSKLGCLLLAVELQRRLTAAGSTVQSYAAHPGVCRTSLGANRRIAAGDRWYQRASSRLLAFGMRYFGQSPEQAADAVLLAALPGALPAGSFVGPTGWLQMAGRPGAVALGPAARDPQLAAALWARCEQLTGLRWTL